MVARRSVLVVDDSPGERVLLAEALAELGAEAVTAEGVVDARAALLERTLDLVVSDWLLGGGDGGEILVLVAELRPELPVVGFTGSALAEDVARARELGAALVIPKPTEYAGYLEAARLMLGLIPSRDPPDVP